MSVGQEPLTAARALMALGTSGRATTRLRALHHGAALATLNAGGGKLLKCPQIQRH